MSKKKKPPKTEENKPAKVILVENIRKILLVLIIVCLIASAFLGKIPRYTAVGGLLAYLGLTYLLERMEKKGGEKK